MRIFLSSTCYNHTELRSRVERFLKEHGHNPILSDRLDFPISPGIHRHEMCVREAAKADMLLMVVGDRFGARYEKDQSISISWAEMRAALENNVEVIAFVRRPIFDERKTWKLNGENIKPAHCDNTDIFRLIDEIQHHPSGIWIDLFEDVEDIVDRLERLWSYKTGRLSPGPTPPPNLKSKKTKTYPLANLSIQTQKYIRSILKLEPQVNYQLTKSNIDKRINELPPARIFVGVMIDSEITRTRPGDLISDYPIRPADDDGCTWYVERGLSAEGHAIRQELQRVKEML